MNSSDLFNRERKKRYAEKAQAMVEFGLVIGAILMIFMVMIELGRIMNAYILVEHSARQALRYAVTGEYVADGSDCFVTDTCDDAKIDEVRLDSITGIARGIMDVLIKEANAVQGNPDYFKTTVCVETGETPSNYVRADTSDPTKPAQCNPQDNPGDPGERVIVTVDYNHRLITPGFAKVWPQLHLSSTRAGIVESFRKASFNPADPDFPPGDVYCPNMRIDTVVVTEDKVRVWLINENIVYPDLTSTYLTWETDQYAFMVLRHTFPENNQTKLAMAGAGGWYESPLKYPLLNNGAEGETVKNGGHNGPLAWRDGSPTALYVVKFHIYLSADKLSEYDDYYIWGDEGDYFFVTLKFLFAENGEVCTLTSEVDFPLEPEKLQNPPPIVPVTTVPTGPTHTPEPTPTSPPTPTPTPTQPPVTTKEPPRDV